MADVQWSNLKTAGDNACLRILHVDDDPCILQASKDILEMEGNFEVDSALSVDEAFQKLAEQSYDAVISDYEMPQKNGLQFLKELRQQKNEIPFVLFTGKGREDVAITALNLGADGYYNKQGSTETVYGELAHGIRLSVERMKAEEALEESEAKYSTLINNARDAVVLIQDSVFKFVNKAGVDIIGYSVEELIGKPFMDVVSPEYKSLVLENFKSFMAGKPVVPYVFKILCKDGTTKDVDTSSGIFQHEGRPAVVGIIRDVTERKKAEEKLREYSMRLEEKVGERTEELTKANEQLQVLFQTIPDALYFKDAQRRFLMVNSNAEKIMGLTQEELVGKTMEQVAPPVFAKTCLVSDEEVLSKKKVLRFEEQTVNAEGETRVFETIKAPMLDSLGNVVGLVGVSRDITENIQRARELLNESEEKFRLYVENSPVAVFVADSAGKYEYVNEAASRLLGYSTKELLEMSIPQILFEKAQPAVLNDFASLQETGKILRNYELKKKGGQPVYVSLNAVKLPNGKLIAFCENITERMKAEENLKNLKEFDERIIDSLDDALLIIDPDNYTIISVNEVALKQLKLKKEDLIGKTCYETTHHRSTPCQPPEHICPIRKVLETKETITVEHTHFDENNNERIVEVSARLVKNPEGKTVVIHVARDITERKQMETRIHEAEKRYHALFDQAPLSILIIDPKTAMPVEFNEVAHEQLGYSREEFAKLRIYDYKAIETSIETKARIEKALREGKAEFETKHRTKNGEIRDVIIVSQAIELSGKKFLHSIYRDVTEAKKVEAALVASEAKYRQLVELAQEGVWALDNDNYTVYVNPRMAEMLGYDESEIVGKNLSAFLDNPGIELAQHNLESCKIGNLGQCEFEFTRKDGAHIYANIAASSIQDDTGNCTGTLALVADITERKKIEVSLKESHDKLEMMNEKLRVVGGLTRHDVRNKLSAVTGYAYLLKKKHAEQADIIDGLGKMEQAAKDIVKIFDFAKMYEQLGVEELTYVDVEKVVNEAIGLFSGLTIKVVNDCRGLTVLADSFLRQLFYNFIDNTRKYGGKPATVRVYYEKAGQDTLRLVYEDDGVGIPKENKLKLFTEGFSTGGSTGYGLYLIKKMIEVYGWTIQETGEPCKGAQFTITIPQLNQNRKNNFQIAPKDDS